MTDYMLIQGGRRLSGTVRLPAAKNSVLPLLAASLLCEGESTLSQVPRLSDVEQSTAILTALGCRCFRTTAQAHDRAMARVQNMNFITTLAYFALLAGDEELLPYITPSFRRRQAAARKMLTEDGAMFCALFEANPYSHEAVRQYRQMLNVAAGGDIDLLCRRARWWWREEEGTPDGAGCARQG